MRCDIDRAGAEDLMQLASDVGPAPMQVGAVLLLDGPPAGDRAGTDLQVLRDLLAQRIGGVPRLRRRLIRTPLGCGRPIWVDDPAFDITAHVRAVRCPPPGDEQALLDVAARLVTEPLPRSRPLWSATLVTRLTGGAALVLVFHHVLADGIGGLAVLAHLVDGAGSARAVSPAAPGPSRRELLTDTWAARIEAVIHPVGLVRRFRQGLAELGPPRAVRALRGSLNRPTGPRRRLATVRSPLAPLHGAARRHGATVNDVVLTAVTGALAALLEHRGEATGRFAVSVIVSGRRAATAADPGNRVGTMPVMLPAVGDPVHRLREIAAITRDRKAVNASRGASAAILAPVFRAMSAVGLLRWFIEHQHMINTFVTNVRGPASRLSFDGVPVREIIPVSGAFGNVTVAFAVLSYAGTLTVTIVADRDRCPDLPVLTQALRSELEALGTPARSRAAR